MMEFLRLPILSLHQCLLLFVLFFSLANTFATPHINTLIQAANQDVMAAKTALHYMQAANVEQWYKAESGDSETQYQ